LHTVQQEDPSGYLACWVRVSKSFPVDRDEQSIILVHIQSIAKDEVPWSDACGRHRLAGWLIQHDGRPSRFIMRYRPFDENGGFGSMKLFQL
jgi:hypothetical protein